MKIKTKEINGERYICISDLEKLFEKSDNDTINDTIIDGFNKKKFGDILQNICNQYYSQRDFCRFSETGRTYINQYINYQLDYAPKPIILRKIAKASKGITTYKELMQVCGYLDGIDE